MGCSGTGTEPVVGFVRAFERREVVDVGFRSVPGIRTGAGAEVPDPRWIGFGFGFDLGLGL